MDRNHLLPSFPEVEKYVFITISKNDLKMKASIYSLVQTLEFITNKSQWLYNEVTPNQELIGSLKNKNLFTSSKTNTTAKDIRQELN